MIIISPILLEGEKWERVKDIAKGQLKGAEKGASVGGGIGLGVGAANVASSMLGSKKSREFVKKNPNLAAKSAAAYTAGYGLGAGTAGGGLGAIGGGYNRARRMGYGRLKSSAAAVPIAGSLVGLTKPKGK